MPFGVELPENFGSTETKTESSVENAPEPKQDLAPEGAQDLATAKKPETIQEILDLDKLERFRFGGKEWNPRDLRNATLRHEDYSRKTMEVAEARRYAENFPYDLESVVRDPSLLDKFKETYPKQYHAAVEAALERVKSPQAPQPTAPNQVATQRNPDIDFIKSEIHEWRAAQRSAEVQKHEGWLDTQIDSLSKKYPYANSNAVLAISQVIADQGNQMTDKILEKLFKENAAENEAYLTKVHKEKVEKQLEVNKKAKDIGQGGGTPGAAPKGAKTLKEAKEAMLSHFSAQ